MGVFLWVHQFFTRNKPVSVVKKIAETVLGYSECTGRTPDKEKSLACKKTLMDAAELGHVVLVVLATAGCVLYKAGAENGNDDVVERNDLGLRKKALKDSGLYVEAPAAAVNLDVKRPSLFLGMQLIIGTRKSQFVFGLAR